VVLEVRVALSPVRGGWNCMVLYKGVGMERMTFLQVNVEPFEIVTFVPVGVWEMAVTGVWRWTVEG